MFFNTSSKLKLPYHATLGVQRWWDNGSVPIWITAQRQVMPAPWHPGADPLFPGRPRLPAQKDGQRGTQRGGSMLPVRRAGTPVDPLACGEGGQHGKRTPLHKKGCNQKMALSPPPPTPSAGWAARPQGRR